MSGRVYRKDPKPAATMRPRLKRREDQAPRRRIWTAENQALLEREDLNNEQIAEMIGCHVNTVRYRRGPSKTSGRGGDNQSGAMRVAYVQTRIFKVPQSALIDEVVEKFGVQPDAAFSDIKTARQQIMADSVAERPAVRAMATMMLKEDRDDARANKQYAAAVAAVREIAKLHGAYEPDKITIVPNEAIELSAIIGILDDAGKAALDVILEQIEGAKAAGRLALPASGGTGRQSNADAEDAEIVGEERN